ncbi:MAG TPA: hypothetical protein VGF50_10320 [Caulobacteraceae bacterium]|jgi:hypothetical protein
MRPFPALQPLLVAAALALAACQPRPETARAPRGPPALQTADPGIAVLAAVENARASIAAGDRLAAFNNVSVALGDATQLSGSDSALFPPEAAPPGYRRPGGGGGYGGSGGRRGGRGGGHGHHGGSGQGFAAAGGAPPGAGPASRATAPAAADNATPPGAAPTPGEPHRHRGSAAAAAAAEPSDVSSFDVQVRLTSIQARLQTGDLAAADADLGAIEASADRHPAPPQLPLVRADQSLALASAAADSGRRGELQTQLQAARASLDAYHGQPHAAEARALAAAIGQALDNPAGLDALAPMQLSLWSGRLASWV